MDPELRSQTLGGGAFVVLGIAVLLFGGPGLLGILMIVVGMVMLGLSIMMIVVGMVMLGLSITGHSSVPALLRERGSARRPRR